MCVPRVLVVNENAFPGTRAPLYSAHVLFCLMQHNIIGKIEINKFLISVNERIERENENCDFN